MINFATVLKEQLEKKEISVNSLCEGLCSESMLLYLCEGERTASKLLQDRLLDRMHLSDIRSENFLFEDEYRLWKLRQQIVKQVNEEHFEQAYKLLEKYERRVCMDNCLEQQFCLVMRIYMMPEAERGAYWEQALKLTVPNIDTKPLSELALSAIELDLLLEYVRACHFDRFQEVCNEVTDYVHRYISDIYIQIKILPKIVYYQCLTAQKRDIRDCAKLLRNCNEVIARLRDAKRLYYFWELLKQREQLCGYFIQHTKRSTYFETQMQEDVLWRKVLEETYAMCGMQPAMRNSCYLYFQQNTFCINEMMQKRRVMLGMTKKALAGDRCSEKTIARTEKGTKMQIAIAREILKLLGLSTEYQRVDVITANPEALMVVRRIADAGNDRDYEEEERQLHILEKMISMDEPLNCQFVKKTTMLGLFKRHKISKEQALRELKEAVEYTMPMECIQNSEELYLTSEETTCLINMAEVLGNHEINQYHKLVWEIAKQYEEQDTVNENISMYEFIMGHVASTLGNVGEYEVSNEISKRIIRENLLLHRLGNVADGVYNMAYNYRDQKTSCYEQEVWKREVTKSMVLFRIMKNHNTEKILKEKLEKNQLY